MTFNPIVQPATGQSISLPHTWFEARITLEQIRESFSTGKEEIRIACGFFTVKGWGLIRRYTEGKRVYLLVGIDEPGEEKARTALIKDILRHLATGLDKERRVSVEDLIIRLEEGALFIVDARATSHHGKLYIVDRHTAINASANTTGRGFLDQIESGGLYAPSVVTDFVSRYTGFPGFEMTPATIHALNEFVRSQVANFIDKFDEYFATAKDITGELLAALKSWLALVSPWDIYLKTILALERIQEVKTSYDKPPVSYQTDMIAQALRQIREYGGSMLVASTGLGKTIMGTHIAIQLRAEDLIDNVIVICPSPVRNSWQEEMHDAAINVVCFTLHTLDLETAKDLSIWEAIEERVRSGRGRYLLILDESHQLRNRYPKNFGNKRYRDEQKIERRAFTRINRLVNVLGERDKVKVLLLSGSPYATEIDNINTQLALLPYSAPSDRQNLFPDLFPEECAWKVKEPEDFIKLPVSHQLTTPHVAKYYGLIDSRGRYITFGDERKYFPDIHLYTLSIPLLFEEELTSAINQKYFDLDISNQMYRKNIVTQVKIAWNSSPLALQEILERVADTPGGLKELDLAKKDKSRFIFSKQERQAIIDPIFRQLTELSYDKDKKLQELIKIVKFYCPREKVIIFCERYTTAYYIEQALKKLVPDLQVFSSIEKSKARAKDETDIYKLKKEDVVEKAIAAFAPVANPKKKGSRESYHVFIATDAFGIGVNMQDASVVVNYDIAWTPIQPIQRAGRVLRFWNSPRIIHLYTFIPILTKQLKPSMEQSETTLQQEVLDIQKRWDNLIARHGESRKFTDLPVLTNDSTQIIDMPDFAPDTEVITGTLTLENADDEDVSNYYKHTRKLHPHRDYALSLASDLTSALTYSGQEVLLYTLLKYQDR